MLLLKKQKLSRSGTRPIEERFGMIAATVTIKVSMVGDKRSATSHPPFFFSHPLFNYFYPNYFSNFTLNAMSPSSQKYLFIFSSIGANLISSSNSFFALKINFISLPITLNLGFSAIIKTISAN